MAGQVVDDLHAADGGRHLHEQRHGLGRLGQQAGDLAGEVLAGDVRVLGEVLVASPRAGQRRQQRLVEAEAVAERGRRDAVRVRLAGHRTEPVGVALAGVGVPVGDENQRRAGRAQHAPGLLESQQVAGGEVGRTTWVHRGDGLLDAGLVAEGRGRHDDGRLVVKDYEAEGVLRVEPVDQGQQRGLRSLEGRPGHGARAVENHLEGRGLPRPAVHDRRAEFEQDGQGVVGLVGEHVDVEVGGEVHDASFRWARLRYMQQCDARIYT
ncbi:MAG: hypothetical protein M3P93_06455 [Actinomycetota bacterium]|nr:hypothetical protein [Actinomycetota bacterium]